MHIDEKGVNILGHLGQRPWPLRNGPGMSLFLQVYLTHHDPIVITELPSPYHMNSCHLLMGGSKPHSEAEICKGFVILSLQSDYLYFSLVAVGVSFMFLGQKLAEIFKYINQNTKKSPTGPRGAAQGPESRKMLELLYP